MASRAIAAATVTGSWVLLQNCHLGLDYMETMEEYLQVDVGCKIDQNNTVLFIFVAVKLFSSSQDITRITHHSIMKLLSLIAPPRTLEVFTLPTMKSPQCTLEL